MGAHILPKRVIIPSGSAPPLAPYSPGIESDNVVYISGTLPIDMNGNIVGEEDIAMQTRHVLKSIRSVIEASGGQMSDIVYNMIFIKDLNHYDLMNEVYKEYFPKEPPARWCIRADLVKPQFLVEISSIAHIEGKI